MSSFEGDTYGNVCKKKHGVVDLTRPDWEKVLKSTFLDILPECAPNDDNFQIDPIHGGITNMLFAISSNSQDKQKFVFRVFGSGMSAVIDRDVENKISTKLAMEGLGPKIYGMFDNGRVEEFIDADTLVPEDFSNSNLVNKLAQSISELHEQTLDNDIPKKSIQWEKLSRLSIIAQGIHFDDTIKQERLQALQLSRISNELIQLSESCSDSKLIFPLSSFIASTINTTDRLALSEEAGRRFASEIVLSHNDLLAGNFLRKTNSVIPYKESIPSVFPESDIPPTSNNQFNDDSSLTIIDFEYSGYNTRAMDIANHFCEYAGFDCDYENKFPSQAQRHQFLRAYTTHTLSKYKESYSVATTLSTRSTFTNGTNGVCCVHEDGDDVEGATDKSHDHQLPNGTNEDDILWNKCHFKYYYELDSEAFIRGVDWVCCKLLPASHLFWGFWAIIQAKNSLIEFDFLRYAELRFHGYELHKHKFLSL